MGALEPSLPPIDPSECSFQDVALHLDEDLLEAMNSLEIPFDDVAMALSNDHIFGLDYPATEPDPNFPFAPDLTIDRSLNIGFEKPSNSTIELQVGVHYEFDVSHRCSESPMMSFFL